MSIERRQAQKSGDCTVPFIQSQKQATLRAVRIPITIGRGARGTSGVLIMFCVLSWVLVSWVCSFVKSHQAVRALKLCALECKAVITF